MTRAALSALAAVAALAGCGGDGETTARTQPRGPLPPALRTVESAAEDTIDFALAGRRAKALKTARTLQRAAAGPAARALRAAGVAEAEIAGFRARVAVVTRLAPHADLLRVALASNSAFAYVPVFFARFETRVPAGVQQLDHLDYEAKLQAIAHDDLSLHGAAAQLARAWRRLRPDVVRAGGARVAARFDAHVARLPRLKGTAAAREAQRGLELVDEVEGVYG